MNFIIDIDPDWLRKSYETELMSYADIAKEVGCSVSTIHRRAMTIGIRSRSRSESHIGHHLSDSAKEKLSRFHKGKRLSDEHRRKLSESRKGRFAGKNHPNYGKHHSVATRRKISASLTGARSLENHPCWLGGKSFEPYCSEFNSGVKERVREKFGRKCYLCGEPENGRKLCVHHVDYNKGQGCGHAWNLLPLCHSCHSSTKGPRWYWFNLLNSYWAMNPDICFVELL